MDPCVCHARAHEEGVFLPGTLSSAFRDLLRRPHEYSDSGLEKPHLFVVVALFGTVVMQDARKSTQGEKTCLLASVFSVIFVLFFPFFFVPPHVFHVLTSVPVVPVVIGHVRPQSRTSACLHMHVVDQVIDRVKRAANHIMGH